MSSLTKGDSMIPKYIHNLMIFSNKPFVYDPDVWGSTLGEAVQRVKDGYYVPYGLVKKLVEHMQLMQSAMRSMEAAAEARMQQLDAKEEKLNAKAEKLRKPRTLLGE
jgi:hypothetical protein